MYCVKEDAITLKTFGFEGEDNEILNLLYRRATKIDSSKLSEILTANFKSFVDKSGGSVAFVKDCIAMDFLQERFLRELSDRFIGINVSSIRFEAQSQLESGLKFREIFLGENVKSTGTFRAAFEKNDFSLKNVYFVYSFDAQMPVFIALNELKPKSILGATDYAKHFVDFNKFDRGSLLSFSTARLVSRANIKPGEVLLKRHFIELSLINKGDKLNAVINEGALSVITEVTALGSGNLGELISVKTNDGKIYKATVSSKKEVIIR
ncbi:flagellar basal body P-ring formation chaperone FlgA [Campylobacter suis]|uniref:flagellar basal body P-ring formation chaperone FlgA n=1 Tax=Campylobacter suis TaxID=2790657 RepID=UPI001E3839CF|nr:flagellar basal body P-ring formation chaperone FlgA [Campylobacter suis]